MLFRSEAVVGAVRRTHLTLGQTRAAPGAEGTVDDATIPHLLPVQLILVVVVVVLRVVTGRVVLRVVVLVS